MWRRLQSLKAVIRPAQKLKPEQILHTDNNRFGLEWTLYLQQLYHFTYLLFSTKLHSEKHKFYLT